MTTISIRDTSIREKSSATGVQKLEGLIDLLHEMESVAVAYSGGVDSTFLLRVAHDVLSQGAVAVTALVTTLARGCNTFPHMTLSRVGYGAGTRELSFPNVLREMIGEAARAPSTNAETLVEL